MNEDDDWARDFLQKIVDEVFDAVRERAIWAANNTPEHMSARDALLAFAECLKRDT